MTPGFAERSQQHQSGITRKPDGMYFWGAFILLLLSAAVGVQQIVQGLFASPPAPESLAAFFQQHMTMTRIVVGAGVILLSPLLLNLALRLFRIAPQCTAQRIRLIAIIPPALAFVLSWLPVAALPIALLLPAFLAIFLIRNGLTLPASRTATTWFFYGLLISLATMTGFYTLESIQVKRALNPLTEFTALRALVRSTPPAEQVFSVKSGTVSPPFSWMPSGSLWFDLRANRAQIEIRGKNSGDREAKLIDSISGDTIARGIISGTLWQSDVFLPTIGAPYTISVPDGFVADDVIRIRSVLPAEISP